MADRGPGPAALVDTDVWSGIFGPRRRSPDPRVQGWSKQLIGTTVVIATQTRAEVLVGLRASDWSDQLKDAVLRQLDSTPTFPVDELIIQAYASLTTSCRLQGHGLGQKEHTGDRWIAATAIATGTRLLSGDSVYRGAQGLSLL